jgi:multiple sugar transport system permease protein
MADYSFEAKGFRNRNVAGKILTAVLIVLLAVIVWQITRSQKSAPDQKIVLNMWDIPLSNISDPYYRAERAVHEEFLRRHPEIETRMTRGIHVEGPARESAFYMAMAGGTAPDVFRINMRSIGSYIDMGFVRPLDDFVAAWPDAQSRIRDALRPAISRQVLDDKGKPVTHIYGIPYYYDVMGFYYRRATFQQAGLPVDGPPSGTWTWDMLWEYGKKCTVPEEGRWGLQLPMGLYGGWMWMNFVWEADADIVKEYGVHPQTGEYMELPPLGAPDSAWIAADGVDLRTVKHIWRAVYDSPGGIEALTFYKKLKWGPWTRCATRECRGKNVCYDITPEMFSSGAAKCSQCGEEISIKDLESQKRVYKGIILVDPSNEMRAFYYEKRVAMLMNTAGGVYVANTSEIKPDEIGCMPCPIGPRGTHANALNALVWGISSQLTDQKKIDAAWEYARWQASGEAEGLRVATMVDAGQARFVDPELLRKHGFAELASYVPRTWADTFLELNKYGRIEPYAPNYTNVQTSEMGIPIDAVFTDESADPASLLHASVKKVNDTIFQEIPLEVMRHRRRIAYSVAAVLVAGLAVAAVYLARGVKDLVIAAHARKAMGLKFAQTSVFAAFAFMIPAVATIFTWQYFPLLRGAVMAFMDYRVIGESLFVGLDNFIRLSADTVFYVSLARTAYYVGLVLIFQFSAPICLALLLSEVPRGKMLYRIIYYLPAITSGLVIMFLWKSFYDPSNGLFNSILTYFGLPKSNWLSSGNGWLPMVCVVIPMVWAGAGPGSLIYLAALKSVPEEIYEAADIDGSSTWQKIAYITLPYLKPLIIINFVGVFIGAFQAMQQIFVMTGGGPARATHVIALDIWYNAFMYLKFGYATAQAWILGLMLIGFTVYQLQILKKVRFTTAKV